MRIDAEARSELEKLRDALASTAESEPTEPYMERFEDPETREPLFRIIKP